MSIANVFIGYDVREHPAWLVCKDSLLYPIHLDIDEEASPQDVNVHALSHKDLRRKGLFDRPWKTDETGQTWDERDGRPFSTDFSHTRFLVPHIAKTMGLAGLVVFVDCDFMFLQPISEMLEKIDRTKVVSVVKHKTQDMQEGTKMDGMVQTRYHRKLWSSLMVFNLDHPDIDRFSAEKANYATGGELHGLLGLEDDEIGSIKYSWNYIPRFSWDLEHVNAVHWSLGGPWMPGYENTRFAKDWRTRYKNIISRCVTQNKLKPLYPMS